MPPVLRVLPRFVIPALVLACNGEPSQSATVEPPVKAEPSVRPEPATKPSVKPEPDLSPTSTPLPPPEPPKAVPPRPAVFFREAPKGRVTVWHLPDAVAMHDLGITADDGGGAVGLGSGAPVLSADGQWLAYLDQGRLQLARIDGTAKHTITKHKANRVTVLIAGFSPDSSALLFHQGEAQAEDSLPLPEGVEEGFQVLTLADLKVSPELSLPSFTTFTEDGAHVILSRRLPDRSTELVRFELATDATETLQRSVDAFAFSQLALHGDRITYVLHADGGNPAADKGSQVVVEGLRGEHRLEITGRGSFAQYQWPRFSLDGKVVAFTDEKQLHARPVDGGATKMLYACTLRCRYSWVSATTVLVLDGELLLRVELDGTTARLVEGVQEFAVAGEAG